MGNFGYFFVFLRHCPTRIVFWQLCLARSEAAKERGPSERTFRTTTAKRKEIRRAHSTTTHVIRWPAILEYCFMVGIAFVRCTVAGCVHSDGTQFEVSCYRSHSCTHSFVVWHSMCACVFLCGFWRVISTLFLVAFMMAVLVIPAMVAYEWFFAI